MESLPYDYKPASSMGWGAAAVALAATTLLVLDFADLYDPFGDGDVGRATYSAVVAAGATIQPTDAAGPLPAIKYTPPTEVIVLLGERKLVAENERAAQP